ncbi:hypothetical protein LXL04_017653 [Taraxacum kok-saghyz]
MDSTTFYSFDRRRWEQLKCLIIKIKSAKLFMVIDDPMSMTVYKCPKEFFNLIRDMTKASSMACAKSGHGINGGGRVHLLPPPTSKCQTKGSSKEEEDNGEEETGSGERTDCWRWRKESVDKWVLAVEENQRQSLKDNTGNKYLKSQDSVQGILMWDSVGTSVGRFGPSPKIIMCCQTIGLDRILVFLWTGLSLMPIKQPLISSNHYFTHALVVWYMHG